MYSHLAQLFYLLYSLSNLGRYLAQEAVSYGILSFPKIGASMAEEYHELARSDDGKLVLQLDVKLAINVTEPELVVTLLPAHTKCFEAAVHGRALVAERLVTAYVHFRRTDLDS